MLQYDKKLCLSALALLVLSACGGGSDSTTASNANEPTTTAAAVQLADSGSVQLAVDPNQEVPVSHSADGTMSVSDFDPTSGSDIQAAVRDVADEVSGVKANDNSGPQIAIISPLPYEYFPFPAKVRIAVDVRRSRKVEIYNGRTLLARSTQPRTELTLNWPRGRHVVMVNAYDEQGHRKTSELIINVGVGSSRDQAGWEPLAQEGQSFNTRVTHAEGVYARYGHDQEWTYKFVPGNARCDAQTFKVAANPNVVNVCQKQYAPLWSFHQFNVGDTLPAGATYRLVDAWGFAVQQYFNANTQGVCSPAAFGADPAPEQKKWCETRIERYNRYDPTTY